MKRIEKLLRTITATALSASMLTACGKPAEDTGFTPVEAVYTAEEIGGRNFDSAFLKLSVQDGENVVISPLSIKMVLNLTAVGAVEDSETQNEILSLFRYKSAYEARSDSYNLVKELNREDGSMTLHNSYWLSEDAKPLNEDYKKIAEDDFGAEGFTSNLSSQSFVNDINDWIEDRTNGMIKKMVSSPLNSEARLVLVNTLYFNNDWSSKFESDRTYNQDFYGTNGTESVKMMHQDFMNLEYGEGERLKTVTMTYRDGSSMKIYIPIDNNENLADIIGELTPEQFTDELKCERTEKCVNVALPKFECEYKGSIKEILQRMGVSRAFDPEMAELQGISDDDLYVSKIIQAVKIRCDEEGTEAAAVTLEAMDENAAMLMPEETIDFIVDRPFMYEIESESGETLFMGVIQNFS